jgi:hypothetical protein
MSDNEVLQKLDVALDKFAQKIEEIPDQVKRVSFYSVRVDKKDVSRSMFRQIQGKIESKFLGFQRPVMVYTPEICPIKIVAKEDGLSFTSAFQTTEEIRDVTQKLRIDGVLEGSLYIASKNVYLTLRIFDADTMAIVWSQSYDSTVMDAEPALQTTGVDFSFGTTALYLRDTSSTEVSTPDFAKFYYADARIAQKLSHKTRLSLTLTGSLLYLYDGIKSSRTTMVSNARGKGTINPATYLGLRLPVIPVDSKKEKKNRDWLAVEFKFGKIWGQRRCSVNTLGFKMESDITKNLTIGAGLAYTGIKKASIGDSQNIKIGGLSYEISVLQFNYRP